MKIRRIAGSQHWTVYAICTDRGEDAIEAARFTAEAKAAWAGVLHHALKDPRGMTAMQSNRCHSLSNRIWQVAFAGKWRMAFTLDENRIILLIKAYKKRAGDGSVDPDALERMEQRRAEYLQSKQDGSLEIIDRKEKP